MKQPNLRHLKVDREGTETIRTALRKKGQATITVHLDAANLRVRKTQSKKAGIPYHRLLKTLLITTVSEQSRFSPEWPDLSRNSASSSATSPPNNLTESASRLGVTRQSVIKLWIAERLKEERKKAS